jgi:hypothetical protein
MRQLTLAGDPMYARGKYHFFASSEENPACVVEPGTPEDVGKIVRSFRLASHSQPSLRRITPFDDQLNVIDATRTPFAVSNRSFPAIPRQGLLFYSLAP